MYIKCLLKARFCLKCCWCRNSNGTFWDVYEISTLRFMCRTNTSTSLSAMLQNLVTWSCRTNDLWCLRFAYNCILVHIFYWRDSFGLIWTCILLCFQFLKTDQFIFSKILQGHFFLYTYIWNVELAWFFFSPLCFNIQRLTFFWRIFYIGHFCQLRFADSLYSAFNTFVLALFIAVVFVCFCSILTFYICKSFLVLDTFLVCFCILESFWVMLVIVLTLISCVHTILRQYVPSTHLLWHTWAFHDADCLTEFLVQPFHW